MKQRLLVQTVSPDAAAQFVFTRVCQCVKVRGACALVLAGGNSPRPVYERLGGLISSAGVDPASLFFFLSDERPVERTDPERNETMLRETLFRVFRPPENNLFFWDAPPASPEAVALAYVKTIEGFFIDQGRDPDIALLGLGADGHTASLFPGSFVLNEYREERPLTADTPGGALVVRVPGNDRPRLSLSARFLRTCRETVFLAGGGGKDKAIGKLSMVDPSIPASWVVGKGTRVLVVE